MATFRKIHVQFWSDPYIQTLSPEKKYFFLYLLTNEKTRQCGIYEITTRQISFDTGYTVETVLILLQYFMDSGKIMFSRETNEIAIKNWNRYNYNKSPDIKGMVEKELQSVKNPSLIDWVHSGNTVVTHTKSSSPERIEREEEKEREQERLPLIQVMLNTWVSNNSAYVVGDDDKKALRYIAIFLAKRKGLEHLSDRERSELVASWERWCFFILQSPKYKTFSLEKISRFYLNEINQSVLPAQVGAIQKKMVD